MPNEIKKQINIEKMGTHGIKVKPKMKVSKKYNKHKHKQTTKQQSSNAIDWLKSNNSYLENAMYDYISEHVTVQVVPYGALYDDKVGFFVELRIDNKTISRSMVPINVPGMTVKNYK